jgi:hypothetical protein
MAQPQEFTRTIDFTERDGDDTNHSALNEEFDAAALTANQIRANLALIQRDDGALKNGIVTADSLNPTAFDAVLSNVAAAVGQAQTASESALTSATTAITARDNAIAAKDAAEIAQLASSLNATVTTTQASIASTNAATTTTKAAEALASQLLANEWAVKTASAVAGGEFSAKYHAQASGSSAAASAGSAATALTRANTATTQAVNASNSAASANSQAVAAASSASDSADSAALSIANSDNVTAVANNKTNIDAAVANAANINSAVSNAANITTVAGINAAVTTVAGISTAVSAVNANASNINAVQANEANINTAVANLPALAGKVSQTSSTGSAVLPSGTQAQRDASPLAGYLRFNSTIGKPEVYTGANWGSVGGGATGGGSDEVFVQNSQAVTTNYTIPTGKNASAVGPISVPNGVSITVSSGSRWVIV